MWGSEGYSTFTGFDSHRRFSFGRCSGSAHLVAGLVYNAVGSLAEVRLPGLLDLLVSVCADARRSARC